METNSSLFIETWIKQSVSEDFITVRTYKLLLYSRSHRKQACAKSKRDSNMTKINFPVVAL
jgi:hypothetical protein